MFTPQYEDLASWYTPENAPDAIELAQMEITSETSSLLKFALNQLPVLVFMCTESQSKKLWCKTIMGADLRELEAGVGELVGRAGLTRRSASCLPLR